MTPREAAISLLEDAANSQGGGLLTRRQGHESIMSHLQREEHLNKAALEWAKSMPESVSLESTTVGRDGDCNPDHAGFNCTVRERQKMQDRITELELERNDFKRALDDLGVTPREAREGAKRSRERAERIAYLDAQLDSTIASLEVAHQHSAKQAERIAELEEQLRSNITVLENAEQESAARTQRINEMEEGVKLLIQTNHNYLDKMKGLQDDIKNLMEADNRGMTLYDMGQLVCGELPEGWEMTIEMEKGYGEAILHKPDGRKIDGSELAESSVEDQIVGLVKLAKGEPSEYDEEPDH